MLMAILESASSSGTFLTTCIRRPFRNMEGHPMISTSRNPSPCRYSAVNSPRTPIEAERSRTAPTKASTDLLIGFNGAAPCLWEP